MVEIIDKNHVLPDDLREKLRVSFSKISVYDGSISSFTDYDALHGPMAPKDGSFWLECVVVGDNDGRFKNLFSEPERLRDDVEDVLRDFYYFFLDYENYFIDDGLSFIVDDPANNYSGWVLNRENVIQRACIGLACMANCLVHENTGFLNCYEPDHQKVELCRKDPNGYHKKYGMGKFGLENERAKELIPFVKDRFSFYMKYGLSLCPDPEYVISRLTDGMHIGTNGVMDVEPAPDIMEPFLQNYYRGISR